MSTEPTDDDLEAAFAREAPFVDPLCRVRALQREQAMRSPFQRKAPPAAQGRPGAVQPGQAAPGSAYGVAAACKRHNINETDALEQALYTVAGADGEAQQCLASAGSSPMD